MDLGRYIVELLEVAFAFWNMEVETVFSILAQSPADFKEGKPWAVVESVEPLFVGVGSALVVLFFIIGFCAESVDIKQELRFEAILKMLIKIGVAEWLVANHMEIAKILFESVGALIRNLGISSVPELTISADQRQAIMNLGFWNGLLFMVLAIVVALIVIVCGFYMLYEVYFRFLRILVIVPLGALAFSTVSGNRSVAHTGITYAKHFMGILIQGVVMVLAILVCNTIISAGIPEFAGNFSDWGKALIYLCELTFSATLTVGAVRTAEMLVRRTMGL